MRRPVGHTPNRTTLGVILTGYKAPVIAAPLVANPIWRVGSGLFRTDYQTLIPGANTVSEGCWSDGLRRLEKTGNYDGVASRVRRKLIDGNRRLGDHGRSRRPACLDSASGGTAGRHQSAGEDRDARTLAVKRLCGQVLGTASRNDARPAANRACSALSASRASFGR